MNKCKLLCCKGAAFRPPTLFAKARRRDILVQKRWSGSESPGSSNNDTASSTIFLSKSFGIGAVAGVLGSLAGMGGGFVMIPLMTSKSLLGLTQHQAHGTSLFAVTATGLAGCLSYASFVQWDVATALALMGLGSARMGARFAAHLDGPSLKHGLGVLMLLMAPSVHIKKHLMGKDARTSTDTTEGKRTSGPNNSDFSLRDIARRVIPAAAIGLGTGFMAGFFGVGGGVIVVPALHLFTGCDHYQALATSLAAMVLPAASGTLAHYSVGNVSMRAAPALALGACIGAFAGGKIAQHHTNESTLQWGFSGLLVFLGVRTFMHA
ncbi:hypothetical protein ACA910_004920 [Epithemia clementina (nom. ined.)]